MTIRGLGLWTLLPFVVAGCTSQPSSSTPPASAPPAATAPAASAHEGMPTGGPPKTDADMIASATSAAPEAVSKDATVIAFDEKMQAKTLRPGTNGWTCMPDMPTSPGPDPMCLDKNGLEWAQAWMAHKNPPANKMGFGYMLMGGSDASNDDPFAEKPKEGQAWVDTGPHVMILNIGDHFEGYPKTHGNPKAPFVMYPNTPYQHLMIPVK